MNTQQGKMGGVKSVNVEAINKFGSSWTFQKGGKPKHGHTDPLLTEARNMNEPVTLVEVPIDYKVNVVTMSNGKCDFVVYGPYLCYGSCKKTYVVSILFCSFYLYQTSIILTPYASSSSLVNARIPLVHNLCMVSDKKTPLYIPN